MITAHLSRRASSPPLLQGGEAFHGLIGVDLDGTLIRRDGSVRAIDLAALRIARRRGIAPIIVTARFPSRSLAIANEAAPDLPLICADGALITGPDGSCRWARRLGSSEVAHLRATCTRHELRHFSQGDTTCYFDPRHADHFAYVAGWCEGSAWQPCGAERDVVSVFGVGTRDAVLAALADARSPAMSRVELDAFQLAPAEMWALRCVRRGVSKARAFARIGQSLGIPRERWAAVGNDLNDLPLLRQVAHGFAMGDAPEPVKRGELSVLSATSETGGGVAEALRSLLAHGFDQVPGATEARRMR